MSGDEQGVAPSPDDVRRIAGLSDPVLRNLQITQTYHDLSQAMARLVTPGANWCTVATWASKQAGQSIRREDLVVAFERLLRETPEVEQNANALMEAGAPIGGYRPRDLEGAIGLLREAIDPAAAFARTSDAVARGNRKVFEEIGAEFARFLGLCEGRPPTEAALDEFGDGLRSGAPPEGQQYLRRAFIHYGRAMRAENLKERAELMLLANLEIGFHEQTRLQPEIIEAMNAPVVDPKILRQRLVTELFPDPASRIRYGLKRLTARMKPLLQARDRLAAEAQRAGRQVVTAALMTLTLPGGRVLWLGRDLPDRFPDILETVEQPDLSAFLQLVDPNPNRAAGAHITDWGDLPQRMRFITDLFRAYHLAPDLFGPPFAREQVIEIRAGRRPPGPL